MELLAPLIDSATIFSETIEAFDVAACRGMQDFERYIPEIGQVYQTPVVGVWENGVLDQKASGARARELLIVNYNFNLPK